MIVCSKYRTVGVYTGALGIGYNPEILAKRKLPEPKCWADLANPIYRDEVQMANPNASGTAYATIATFVQIFGEDKAFELLKGMHRNINNYPRSGPGAIRAVGRGESGIAEGGAGAARRAEDGRNQADRLRLREMRQRPSASGCWRSGIARSRQCRVSKHFGRGFTARCQRA